MRKIRFVLPLVLLLAVLACCALAEEATVYYGAIAGAPHPDHPDERLVQVRHNDIGAFWLRVPEDGPASIYYERQAARFTLSEPPPAGGFRPDDIITPATFNVVGLLWGEVISIAPDYVETYMYRLAAVNDSAPTIRLAITDETWQAKTFVEGDPVRVIYDPQTSTALEIDYSNG